MFDRISGRHRHRHQYYSIYRRRLYAYGAYPTATAIVLLSCFSWLQRREEEEKTKTRCASNELETFQMCFRSLNLVCVVWVSLSRTNESVGFEMDPCTRYT